MINIPENQKGKQPEYKGNVQLKDSTVNVGSISIWKNKNPSKENSPCMTGQIQVGERTYRVALWENKL